MQWVSSRIWTRVAVSISYDDNHYTTYGDVAIQLVNHYTTGTPHGIMVQFELVKHKYPNQTNIPTTTILIKHSWYFHPKAPFPLATTPRGRGGRDSFPLIDPLYPWSIPYNAEC